jgi:hypothetical protein
MPLRLQSCVIVAPDRANEAACCRRCDEPLSGRFPRIGHSQPGPRTSEPGREVVANPLEL